MLAMWEKIKTKPSTNTAFSVWLGGASMCG